MKSQSMTRIDDARSLSFPRRLLMGPALMATGVAIWVLVFQVTVTDLGIDRNRRETWARVTSHKSVDGPDSSGYQVEYVFSVPSQGTFVGSGGISSLSGPDTKVRNVRTPPTGAFDKEVRVEYNARAPEFNRPATGQSPRLNIILCLARFVVLAMLFVAPFLLFGILFLLTLFLDLKVALLSALGRRNAGKAAQGTERITVRQPPILSAVGGPSVESAAKQVFGEIMLQREGERLLIHRSSWLWVWPLVLFIFVGALLGGLAVGIISSILTGSGEVTMNGTPLSRLRPDQQTATLLITGGLGFLLAFIFLLFVGASFVSFLQSLLQSRFPAVLDRRRGVVLLGPWRVGLLGAIEAVQVSTKTHTDEGGTGSVTHAVTLVPADDGEDQRREQLPMTAAKYLGVPLAAAVTLYAAQAAEDWSLWNLAAMFLPAYCLLGCAIAALTFLLQKLLQLFRPSSAQRLRQFGLHKLLRTQRRETAEQLAHQLSDFLAVPLRQTP